MNRIPLCVRALMLAALSLPAFAQAPRPAALATPSTPAAAVRQAAWPPEIVRLADEALKADPQAAEVRDERQRAQQVVDLLRGQDVQLFRPAFEADLGSPEASADLRRAGLGDVAATLRVARHYCGDGITPLDASRCIGWLQLAAKLGSGPAAYQLALHYRRTDQPLLASNYETQAISLGFTPPKSLDHVRK